MNGPRASWVAVALLAAGIAPVASAEPELSVERAEGLTRVETSFPAGLFGYVVPVKADGTRSIYLLAPTDSSYWEKQGEADDEADDEEGDAEGRPLPPCPEEEDDGPTLTLYRLDPSGDGRLDSLRSDLPPGCEMDALDLDRDGDEELLLRCEDRWYRLDPDGEGALPQPILEGARAITWIESEDSLLYGVVPGTLRVYSWDPDVGRMQIATEVELPREGKARSGSVWVGSPLPTFVGRDPRSAAIFATAPQQVGKRRLRTTLIEVSEAGEAKSTECWVSLPSAEFLLESDFLMREGRPVLVVTTMSAEKVGLFGEKLLRVYPLRRDRSRLGALPLFEARTRMNLWQESNARLTDVNDDGEQDLVLGYWKGLKDDRIVLDVHLGRAEGGFESSPRTTAFDVKDGDRVFHFYGDDLDGDGVADLLVRSGSPLQLYPGLPSSNGKKIVGGKPREIPLGGLPGAELEMMLGGKKGGGVVYSSGSVFPDLVDLDGDGVSEIVVARDKGNLPGVFHAIWLRP